MSYSQNDEEAAIIAFFRPRSEAGRFLDIGAHDGVTLSNTRRLFELGWHGTVVEPSPCVFPKLMDLYRDREEMNLVNVALVAGEPRILKFYDSRGDFVSTFDEKHRALWAAPGSDRGGIPYQPIYVAATTVGRLLESFPGPYAFISLDVEGINWDLFRELSLQQLGCEMVCVEYQDKLTEIEAHAVAQGYRRYHLTSENALYVRR